MKMFKNIFLNLSPSARVDFLKLAYVRRERMIQEGFAVNNINWDHYARVLEEKHNRAKNGFALF
jgi:hypothetical protein